MTVRSTDRSVLDHYEARYQHQRDFTDQRNLSWQFWKHTYKFTQYPHDILVSLKSLVGRSSRSLRSKIADFQRLMRSWDNIHLLQIEFFFPFFLFPAFLKKRNSCGYSVSFKCSGLTNLNANLAELRWTWSTCVWWVANRIASILADGFFGS